MDGVMFIGTWWSLVPPLLAIILALVTKEVYSSLFIGVAFGALLYISVRILRRYVGCASFRI